MMCLHWTTCIKLHKLIFQDRKMMSTAQQMLQDSRTKIELLRMQIIKISQARDVVDGLHGKFNSTYMYSSHLGLIISTSTQFITPITETANCDNSHVRDSSLVLTLNALSRNTAVVSYWQIESTIFIFVTGKMLTLRKILI